MNDCVTEMLVPAPMATARQLRVALVPWMVAGVRTQYENLRAFDPPLDLAIDAYPITPTDQGGIIGGLPLLAPSHKGLLRSTAQILPLLRRPDYDVILTQTLLPLVPLLALCDAHVRTLPTIVLTIDTTPALMDGFSREYYGRPPSGRVRRRLHDTLFRHALRRCAAVTPWSAWAARSFAADYGVPADRIHIIPPGIDLTLWSIPARRYGRGTGNRAGQPFHLLFVGADFARKGGPLLLDLFRAHLRDTCELHLVTREAIPEEPGLHVYRGLGPNEPGLRHLYERCDALVLPTRADCFSLASLEAMACGLPVITCPVGGIPEIVQHGKTGFLVPPDDGARLLCAIRTLLSDPVRSTRMGLAGRRVVEERFDNARVTAALFDLLLQVGEEKRP